MSRLRRLIEGIEEAQRGDLASVTVEGQTWVRRDWQSIDSAPRDGSEVLWTNLDTTTVIKWPEYRECFEEGWWMPRPSPPSKEGE